MLHTQNLFVRLAHQSAFSAASGHLGSLNTYNVADIYN